VYYFVVLYFNRLFGLFYVQLLKAAAVATASATTMIIMKHLPLALNLSLLLFLDGRPSLAYSTGGGRGPADASAVVRHHRHGRGSVSRVMTTSLRQRPGGSYYARGRGLHAEPSSSSSSGREFGAKVPATMTTTASTRRTQASNEDDGDQADPNDGRTRAYLSRSTNDGGYTVKQRLREEVESPFRKVRLFLFASSAGSALTALYFSALATARAAAGGGGGNAYAAAAAASIPLDEALTSDAINLVAAVLCGALALREYRVGEANLERIARGGRLASLVVEPATAAASFSSGAKERMGPRMRLADYRRSNRVLIAAGGEEYISTLARSLTADQLKDENIFPQKLADVDVVVVPVLLVAPPSSSSSEERIAVGDTRAFWNSISCRPGGEDRNFDVNRANGVVSFPIGSRQWSDYLASEIGTAAGQGYDVLKAGITLTVKKNGRILRRATGQPPWGDLIGTMEVMDGSRFGMPGDSDRY
jgi:Low psii accumulation1 / Rep27